MEFFDVISTRQTIRKYTQDIPPQSDIKKIADAGRLAPSATNSQNWKFIAILNTDIKEKMAKAVNDKYDYFLSFVKEESERARINGSRYYASFFVNAPVVFAIVETHRAKGTLDLLAKNGMPVDELERYDNRASILSMGAAIENMSLAAHALGFGTCWMCAPLAAQKEFGEILGIDKDDKVVTLLSMGYPIKGAHPTTPKKSLEDVFYIVN